MNEMAEAMKVDLLAAVLTISEKISPPASHPPTEMSVLKPARSSFKAVNLVYNPSSYELA